MKFTRAALLTVLATTITTTTTAFQKPAAAAFVTNHRLATKTTTTTIVSSTTTNAQDEETKPTVSKKEQRLKFMKSDQFYRRGFKEVRENVEENMKQEFESDIVGDLKSSNYRIEKDNVEVYLAKDFGFCWGVVRSIALAYEAVEHFPDRQVHLTNELIHNPEVNELLQDKKVKLVEKLDVGGTSNAKDFSTVKDGDVVILPAFGATFEEMDLLDRKNVEIVDTTCPWVSKVWNTVDTHQKKGLTSVIHGKYAHEETVATTSFCEDYICVKNMKEAQMVADYIVNGGDRDEFLSYFKNAISDGFDPDTMLQKIGLANQTTMYKKETRAIGQLLQKAILTKFGPTKVNEHYMEFDTICDATQERQDAIHELVENVNEYDLDFILVIGGWDSSNTAHLLEIPHNAGIRSFHINRAECIGADNTIRHRTVDGEIVTEPFILDLDKKITLGVTSGASTPDAAVQDSLSSIFLLKKMHDTNTATKTEVEAEAEAESKNEEE